MIEVLRFVVTTICISSNIQEQFNNQRHKIRVRGNMGINVTDPQLGHGCVDMSLKAIKEKKKDIIDP